MNAATTKPLSNIAGWVLVIVDALKKQGIDAAPLLEKAGISKEDLSSPNNRIPIKNVNLLWQEVITATDDDSFALNLPRRVKPQALHGLAYAATSSMNVRDLMARTARFSRVASTVAQIYFEEDEEHFILFVDTSKASEQPAKENLDAFMALISGNLRYLINDPLTIPVKLKLKRKAPNSTSTFERVYRCPIEFEADVNAIYYNKKVLELNNPYGNRSVAEQNDKVITDYLSSFDETTLSQKVQNILAHRLSSGVPSQDQVASEFNLSLRTFQRRLKKEGTTFKEIVDAVRFGLAKEYLNTGKYGVTEIGYLLGFNDSSYFTRAFKRWSGTPPSDYIKQNHPK